MEDPFELFSSFLTWFNSRRIALTFPFHHLGRNVSIHYSCDLPRGIASALAFFDDVYLAHHVWINAVGTGGPEPKVILKKGCRIGRRSMISAKNQIVLEEDVLLSPSVLIMDHNHEFSDITKPIVAQGITEGGRITIGKNCWLGYGAAILCDGGHLTIGQNSVIGANAVVTRSVPSYSVVAGNPARIVKSYSQNEERWTKPRE